MLSDPESRNLMGLEGRRWVLRHFDEREQLRQTQELYLGAYQNASNALGHPTQVGQAKIEKLRVASTEGGERE